MSQNQSWKWLLFYRNFFCLHWIDRSVSSNFRPGIVQKKQLLLKQHRDEKACPKIINDMKLEQILILCWLKIESLAKIENVVKKIKNFYQKSNFCWKIGTFDYQLQSENYYIYHIDLCALKCLTFNPDTNPKLAKNWIFQVTNWTFFRITAIR